LPLHIGRNTMVWQTTIRDATDKRIAVVTQTQLVLVRDPVQ
jgi:acyl-coenzyme A thioesterase PaaI-like protein